jgi:hypothetical protein
LNGIPPYMGVVELPQLPEAHPLDTMPWAQFPPAQPGPDIIIALPSVGTAPEKVCPANPFSQQH